MKNLIIFLSLIVSLSGIAFAQTYEKVDDTHFKIVSSNEVTIELDQLEREKADNLREIDRLEKVNAMLDAQIAEAKKLGIKTQAEVSAEKAGG